MHKFHENFTKSRYNGEFSKAVNAMHGMGHYIFPDGTEYRGGFAFGKFHGYGRVHLADPFKTVIAGIFYEGKLVEIGEIIFPDHLNVDTKVDGTNMNFNNWSFCQKNDRRFNAEVKWGLEPIGPNSLITKNWITRPLQKNHYDIEEGVFSHDTHHVTKRHPPLSPIRYISCKNEQDWILKHCRKGDDGMPPEEPEPEVCREIIATNICAATTESDESWPDYICNVVDCKSALAKERLRKQFCLISTSMAYSPIEHNCKPDLPAFLSSQSSNSLQDNNMIIDMNERLTMLNG